MWIPFAHLDDVIELISKSLNTGIANGWDKNYEPCDEQDEHSETQTNINTPADIADLIQQAQEISVQLQKQLEAAKAIQPVSTEKAPY